MDASDSDNSTLSFTSAPPSTPPMISARKNIQVSATKSNKKTKTSATQKATIRSLTLSRKSSVSKVSPKKSNSPKTKLGKSQKSTNGTKSSSKKSVKSNSSIQLDDFYSSCSDTESESDERNKVSSRSRKTQQIKRKTTTKKTQQGGVKKAVIDELFSDSSSDDTDSNSGNYGPGDASQKRVAKPPKTLMSMKKRKLPVNDSLRKGSERVNNVKKVLNTTTRATSNDSDSDSTTTNVRVQIDATDTYDRKNTDSAQRSQKTTRQSTEKSHSIEDAGVLAQVGTRRNKASQGVTNKVKSKKQSAKRDFSSDHSDSDSSSSHNHIGTQKSKRTDRRKTQRATSKADHNGLSLQLDDSDDTSTSSCNSGKIANNRGHSNHKTPQVSYSLQDKKVSAAVHERSIDLLASSDDDDNAAKAGPKDDGSGRTTIKTQSSGSSSSSSATATLSLTHSHWLTKPKRNGNRKCDDIDKRVLIEPIKKDNDIQEKQEGTNINVNDSLFDSSDSDSDTERSSSRAKMTVKVTVAEEEAIMKAAARTQRPSVSNKDAGQSRCSFATEYTADSSSDDDQSADDGENITDRKSYDSSLKHTGREKGLGARVATKMPPPLTDEPYLTHVQVKGNDMSDSDNDSDVELPYSQNLGLSLADKPKHALKSLIQAKSNEPLRPGDVIFYNHPAYVAGTAQARRVAQVLKISDDTDCPLRLDNIDCLPMDARVRRIKEWKNGSLIDHPGISRCIEQFQLKYGTHKGERFATNNRNEAMKSLVTSARRDAERLPLSADCTDDEDQGNGGVAENDGAASRDDESACNSECSSQSILKETQRLSSLFQEQRKLILPLLNTSLGTASMPGPIDAPADILESTNIDKSHLEDKADEREVYGGEDFSSSSSDSDDSSISFTKKRSAVVKESLNTSDDKDIPNSQRDKTKSKIDGKALANNAEIQSYIESNCNDKVVINKHNDVRTTTSSADSCRQSLLKNKNDVIDDLASLSSCESSVNLDIGLGRSNSSCSLDSAGLDIEMKVPVKRPGTDASYNVDGRTKTKMQQSPLTSSKKDSFAKVAIGTADVKKRNATSKATTSTGNGGWLRKIGAKPGPSDNHVSESNAVASRKSGRPTLKAMTMHVSQGKQVHRNKRFDDDLVSVESIDSESCALSKRYDNPVDVIECSSSDDDMLQLLSSPPKRKRRNKKAAEVDGTLQTKRQRKSRRSRQSEWLKRTRLSLVTGKQAVKSKTKAASGSFASRDRPLSYRKTSPISTNNSSRVNVTGAYSGTPSPRHRSPGSRKGRQSTSPRIAQLLFEPVDRRVQSTRCHDDLFDD